MATRPAPVHSPDSSVRPRKHGSSCKRCFCNLSWCNRLVHGELDSGGKGYPYGGMNLPKGRPELRSWLTHLGCTDRGADGDPWWTPERVSACVADPRQAPFDKMRIGRWHFSPEMLNSRGRLDWGGSVKPFPSATERQALSALYPSPKREKPLIRALDAAFVAAQHNSSAAAGHLHHLRDQIASLERKNSDMRARLTEQGAYQKAANALIAFQQEALADVEQGLLLAEAEKHDLETTIAMLEAQPKAWLSHDKLLNDPVLSANIKEFSFFDSVEAHCIKDHHYMD